MIDARYVEYRPSASELPVKREMIGKIDPLQWIDKPVPDRRWRIHGRVPDGAVTMCSGDGGVGKSLLAQQGATCVATSRDFLGMKVEPCKALAIFCEDEADELHRRQAAINRALGLEFGDLENLTLVSRVGQANEFLSRSKWGKVERPSDFYNQTLDLARESGAQFIVLDGLHDLFDGNENSRPEARQFINLLRKIALENDGAVWLNAHPSLSGISSGTGSAGSTAWNNAVRSRLYLKRPAGDDYASDVRELETKKANYGEIGQVTRLRYLDGAFVTEGVLEQSGMLGSIRRVNCEKAVLRALDDLISKGMTPAPTIHSGDHYITKLLRKHPELAGYEEREISKAVNAHQMSGEIVLTKTPGPPSRSKQVWVPKQHPWAQNSNAEAIEGRGSRSYEVSR